MNNTISLADAEPADELARARLSRQAAEILDGVVTWNSTMSGRIILSDSVHAAKRLLALGEVVLPWLLGGADGLDEDRQVFAAYVFGLTNYATAVPLLRRWTQASDRGLRAECARSLRLLNAVEAEPELLTLLQDAESSVQAEAVSALAHIGSLSALDCMTKALQSDDDWLRQSAARALSEHPAPEALAILCEQLSHPDAGVREELVRGLARRASLLQQDAARELLVPLTRDPELRVRRIALHTLIALGPEHAREELFTALADPDWSQCQLAIEGLRGLPDMRERLWPLLEARAGNRLHAVARLLAHYRVPEDIPHLGRALQNAQGAKQAKSLCAALGEFKHADARPYLEAALQSEDKAIRGSATAALRRLPKTAPTKSRRKPEPGAEDLTSRIKAELARRTPRAQMLLKLGPQAVAPLRARLLEHGDRAGLVFQVLQQLDWRPISLQDRVVHALFTLDRDVLLALGGDALEPLLALLSQCHFHDQGSLAYRAHAFGVSLLAELGVIGADQLPHLLLRGPTSNSCKRQLLDALTAPLLTATLTEALRIAQESELDGLAEMIAQKQCADLMPALCGRIRGCADYTQRFWPKSISALTALCGTAAAPLLIELAQGGPDGAPNAPYAMHALGRLGVREALPLLRQRLLAIDNLHQAALALRNLGWQPVHEREQLLLAAGLGDWKTVRSYDVAGARIAALALQRKQVAEPGVELIALVDTLPDDEAMSALLCGLAFDGAGGQAAAQALARRGPQACQAAGELLLDESELGTYVAHSVLRTKRLALQVLQDYPGDAAAPWLRRFVAAVSGWSERLAPLSPSWPADGLVGRFVNWRREALLALADYKAPADELLFAEVLTNDDATLRRCAVEFLGAIRAQGQRDAVAACLQDSAAAVRVATVKALVRLGGELALLEPMASDPDATVRKAVATALAKADRRNGGR